MLSNRPNMWDIGPADESYHLYFQEICQSLTSSSFSKEEHVNVKGTRRSVFKVLLAGNLCSDPKSKIDEEETVDSMEVEELQRKNAPGVAINRGGDLIDLCFRLCSDDLNISFFLLAELLDRAIDLCSRFGRKRATGAICTDANIASPIDASWPQASRINQHPGFHNSPPAFATPQHLARYASSPTQAQHAYNLPHVRFLDVTTICSASTLYEK